MNIAFTQIYLEPGVDFNLPGPLLRAARDRLSGLGLHAPYLNEAMQRDDFKLVFILGAHKGEEGVRVASPIFRRRQLEVEIPVSLPWVRCNGFDATVAYALPLIGEAVSQAVVNGPELIQLTMRKLVDDVMASPEAYQWPKK
jgi:hypothetical protein